MDKTLIDRVPSDTIIVIGRQFGSGGRRIGKALAEALGFKYYDKELLSEAAAELGFSHEIFQKNDEKKPTALSSLLLGAFGVTEQFGPGTLSGEGIYKEQSHVIESLAQRHGCVIVGRTADYIMRGHPHLVSIFLHAPVEYRSRLICDRKDAGCMEKAAELARKRDRERESYYNYFTGRRWGAASNYDLTLDASQMSPEEAAEVIVTYVASKLQNKN